MILNGNHQKYLYKLNQENNVNEQAIAEGM